MKRPRSYVLIPVKGRRRAAFTGALKTALAISLQGLSRFKDLAARASVVRWLTAALEGEPAELTVRFVDRREGRRLNREFRHKDYATNVLTFDYQHAPVVIADIVICVPVLRDEARAQRKMLRHHLAHLLVHGVLHARGEDHISSAPARQMEAHERNILLALGHPEPYVDDV